MNCILLYLCASLQGLWQNVTILQVQTHFKRFCNSLVLQNNPIVIKVAQAYIFNDFVYFYVSDTNV